MVSESQPNRASVAAQSPGAVFESGQTDRPPQSSVLPLGNKLARMAWGVVWLLLFRPSPAFLHAWRCMLLRLFGARVARGAHVYPSVRIWAPWNLALGEFACLGYHVDVYCVAPVRIGARTTVSQYSHLCAATHDYTKPHYPLLTMPIEIGDDCWLAADTFVGPGVTIGTGAVIGARSTVLRDIPEWVVAAGHPAKVIKAREYEGRAPA
ncbi:MAG: putative colanic acid biosynthesis acetyltransferase [Phycisphaerales bacterium]